MNLFEIKVKRTARIFHSELNEESTTLWICLHGYGELASEFYARLEPIADEKSILICPEGLSRFYTRGGSGPVGASWMTKESREDEISDYILYLNDVLERLLDKAPHIKEINILGFSQGAATACRWVEQLDKNINRLILWGAVFPPDMTFTAQSTKTERILFAGKADQYLKEEAVKEMENNFDRVIRYDGGHSVDVAVLRKALTNS
jgi:predicted esterase